MTVQNSLSSTDENCIERFERLERQYKLLGENSTEKYKALHEAYTQCNKNLNHITNNFHTLKEGLEQEIIDKTKVSDIQNIPLANLEKLLDTLSQDKGLIIYQSRERIIQIRDLIKKQVKNFELLLKKLEQNLQKFEQDLTHIQNQKKQAAEKRQTDINKLVTDIRSNMDKLKDNQVDFFKQNIINHLIEYYQKDISEGSITALTGINNALVFFINFSREYKGEKEFDKFISELEKALQAVTEQEFLTLKETGVDLAALHEEHQFNKMFNIDTYEMLLPLMIVSMALTIATLFVMAVTISALLTMPVSLAAILGAVALITTPLLLSLSITGSYAVIEATYALLDYLKFSEPRETNKLLFKDE
ncbi:MAG: hypothetical protein CMF38_07625 [Legionellaceae bacterium]|nr:hypothetical protein [Legionellaceae bacterium]MBJ16482.1 hypothetical protein [Legionellaceae bacterium]HCA89767.1 hypothetical protein [Legionellales bacterium]|tara:strand:- start:12424 stop:13509 length:1086 start_codon:yes stop_codon:yes gene_type:complete